MPLPPRDMSAAHVCANPALREMHRLYPLSRYAPVMGALKLFQLAASGVPLVSRMDVPCWLVMACLDDAGADFCIAHLVQTIAHCPTAPLYPALAHVAAPFTVPMMVPMTCYGPAAADPASLPSRATTHVSDTAQKAATSTAASSATDLEADATSRRRTSRPVKGLPASSSLAGLPSTVLRAICHIATDHGVDINVFERVGGQLKGMTSAVANGALAEFDRALAAGRAERSAGDHRAELTRALMKHVC